jgi:glycosyltransferase involved in cell wall biosynthesis
LLVPDSTYWVTGTIAKSIARFNPWIEATIASGPVIDALFSERPEMIHNFDLVHFICPYASREWLPRFRDFVPCVTSHHHVTDWEAVSHNLEGDAIVVGSNEWAEDLRPRGVDMTRVFCVPYGVDASAFRAPTPVERATVRAHLRIAASATVIGFFGKNSSNDNGRKGIDVFTEAIIELRKTIRGLCVLIVGPGWQSLVDSLRASGADCVWRPFITNQNELARMYHALDFYWVTSRIEGGPVTLLEAMSSEVCCLTTSVGIAREIVRDGENALLVPFNGVRDFVDRTVALAGNAEERARMGRKARESILETMHAGITTQRVREVYQKALDAARKRLGEFHFALSEIDENASPADMTAEPAETVPLHGFPFEIHPRVRMLEAMAWSEHLILYQQQRTVALKLILQQWIKNPLSLLAPRVLLRRFMPTSIVARIVRLKNGSHPKLKEMPDQLRS